MQLQTSISDSHRDHVMLAFFPRPSCPHCGDIMFAATATEYVGRGHIRYFWSCESCNHEFETAVDIPD